MAIEIITGVPATGKTSFALTKIIEFHAKYPDRDIYSNIDGLILDYVALLPDDYRDCPHGSFFVIDEAQRIPRFSSDDKKAIDDVAKDLAIHRHMGFDFIFITQDCNLLNNKVLAMVETHYHLASIMNTNNSTLYTFNQVQRNPNTASVRKACLDVRIFTIPKKNFELYKSAVMHNKRLKIPRKVFFVAFVMICLIFCLYFSVYYLLHSDNFLVSKIVKSDKSSFPSFTPASVTSVSNSSLPSVNASSTEVSFKYDFEKPLDDSIYKNQKYQPLELPKFSGAVIMDKKCTAYTQQGTIAKITQLDCIKIANGEIPFNPFKSQNNKQIEIQEHKKI